ncbi:MAG TPA: alpha/beta hydrolase [Thauera sp.]|nr:alpha/beta hydrolase [Thauera sp.]
MSMKHPHTTSQDTAVEGPHGRLFVRTWSPDAPSHRAPIILLHDLLGSVELWRGFPAALCKATARQVVAYDRLGFGKSDPHPGTLALDFIAREAEGDFAAVIRQLGIARFIVFGHSVGGGMAVNCAAHHGVACVGLITESAQAFVEDRTVEGLEDARVFFKDPVQIERLKRYHGDKAQWVLDAWIESWLDPAFANWSLRRVLPRVKCPTLAIHGIDDEYGSSAHPELIAELCGGPARLQLMADTRHVPHRERETDVIELLKPFISALAA